MITDIKVLENKYFYRDLPVPYNTQTYEIEHREKIASYKNILKALENQISDNASIHFLEINANTLNALNDEIKGYKTQLFIHPPTMSDYDLFYYSISSLTMDVNDDIENIGVEEQVELLNMSYLDYMIWSNLRRPEKEVISKFKMLLELIFKIEVDTVDVFIKNDRLHLKINESEEKDCSSKNIILSCDDIELIKKIVCHQSMRDYNDGYVTKDVQLELKTMNEIRGNRYEPVTLEKKVCAVSSLTHIKEDDLWNMTIRRFNLKDETSYDILQWTVNSLVEGMGHFKFKKPVEHFLFKNKKEGIDGFIPYQEMADKFK